MAHEIREMTLEEEQKMLADFDKFVAETRPNYFAGAVKGMTFAWMYGFLANKPAKGNRLKYAAYGAGVYMLAQFAGHALLKKTDDVLHEGYERKHYPTPRTPVVTSGYFAGAPRPLYHAGLGPGGRYPGGAYHVGAPPPDRDYSFTRRPGFNGKDY